MTDEKLSCSILRLLNSDMTSINTSMIIEMPDADFLNCLEVIGNAGKWSEQQLSDLLFRAKTVNLCVLLENVYKCGILIAIICGHLNLLDIRDTNKMLIISNKYVLLWLKLIDMISSHLFVIFRICITCLHSSAYILYLMTILYYCEIIRQTEKYWRNIYLKMKKRSAKT